MERLRGSDFLDIAQLDRMELDGILDLAGRIKASGERSDISGLLPLL